MNKTSVLQHLLICVLLLTTYATAHAQKQFKLIVNLPADTDQSKIEFWLEDGKSNNRVKATPTSENQLVVTGEYYGIYAAVRIQRPRDGSAEAFGNTFFVQEKTATISFFTQNSPDLSLKNYSLENMEDFKVEKQRREQHSATELKNAMDFEAVYFDTIFNGTNASIKNHYFNVLVKAVGRKDLEYVEANPNSYYSFYIFKYDVVTRAKLSPDSLLMVFKKFPEKYRMSDEGNYLHEFIISRSAFKGNEKPIEFTARDIHGKNIKLSDYRNKKMVLLHFWGTWCTPCIEELPALKEIRNHYGSDQLEIISITVSSNDSSFARIIKQYAMDWTHIHNNNDIYERYGATSTPRVCLIDKDWKIIYDSFGPGQENDLMLTKLNKVLTDVSQ